MTALAPLIRAHGGLIATHELAAAGIGRAVVRRMVDEQQLWRIRQGWYAAPGTEVELTHASRVGGLLTCSSALRRRGVWALDLSGLHVRVHPNACQLRAPRDRFRRLADEDAEVVVHWRDDAVGAVRGSVHDGIRGTAHRADGGCASDAPTRRLLASLSAALHDYRSCAGQELYLAALDSALHQHPLARSMMLASGHPVGTSGIDGICESGLETIVWLRLRSRLAVRRQVSIAGIGRVDFVVGDRLVIEVDGREHHSRREPFELDRRRDATLAARGYRTLRFSYRQVMHDWDAVELAILGACAQGHHLA